MEKALLTKCLRCRGAVIHENFFSSDGQFWGWKCLICGEIIDPIILQNRQLPRAEQGIDLHRGAVDPARFDLRTGLGDKG